MHRSHPIAGRSVFENQPLIENRQRGVERQMIRARLRFRYVFVNLKRNIDGTRQLARKLRPTVRRGRPFQLAPNGRA